MITNEKVFAEMRIAELNTAAKARRVERELQSAGEPMPRWSIIRLIRPHRPVAAA